MAPRSRLLARLALLSFALVLGQAAASGPTAAAPRPKAKPKASAKAKPPARSEGIRDLSNRFRRLLGLEASCPPKQDSHSETRRNLAAAHAAASKGQRLPKNANDPECHYFEGSDFGPIIMRNAEQFQVSPFLIRAMIETESSGNPASESVAGARGLMQLMPDTARWINNDKGIPVVDVYDPEDNIRGGTWYIRFLLDHYDGNAILALSAYNAGQGSVDRHWKKLGRLPDFDETLNYAPKTFKFLAEIQEKQELCRSFGVRSAAYDLAQKLDPVAGRALAAASKPFRGLPKPASEPKRVVAAQATAKAQRSQPPAPASDSRARSVQMQAIQDRVLEYAGKVGDPKFESRMLAADFARRALDFSLDPVITANALYILAETAKEARDLDEDTAVFLSHWLNSKSALVMQRAALALERLSSTAESVPEPEVHAALARALSRSTDTETRRHAAKALGNVRMSSAPSRDPSVHLAVALALADPDEETREASERYFDIGFGPVADWQTQSLKRAAQDGKPAVRAGVERLAKRLLDRHRMTTEQYRAVTGKKTPR